MSNGVQVELGDLLELRQAASELDLFARNRAQSQLAGSVKTHFRGRGIDFEEVRNYQPGDEVRSIDWRVTARTGKPHTKLFREDRERPVLVAVDQRLPMAFGSRRCFKSVQAAETASLLLWAALANNDRAGGLIFGDDFHEEIRPQRSRHAVMHYLRSLARANQVIAHRSSTSFVDTSPKQLNNALEELYRIVRPGSALFIVSDFHGLDDNGARALLGLKRHCDVNVLLVFDPMEQQLPVAANLNFSSGSKRVRVDNTSAAAQQQFEQQFSDRFDRVRATLTQRGIPLIALSTAKEALTQLLPIYHRANRRARQVRRSMAAGR